MAWYYQLMANDIPKIYEIASNQYDGVTCFETFIKAKKAALKHINEDIKDLQNIVEQTKVMEKPIKKVHRWKWKRIKGWNKAHFVVPSEWVGPNVYITACGLKVYEKVYRLYNNPKCKTCQK